jgi:hypothetical protein
MFFPPEWPLAEFSGSQEAKELKPAAMAPRRGSRFCRSSLF